MTMTILHQSSSRYLGRKDGFFGRPSQCPKGADALAYATGFTEGRAERDRGIAGAVGMNNDGFPNVVEKGWPRKMPTIIDDEDEDEI